MELKVLVKNGRLETEEPLPSDWGNGTELVVVAHTPEEREREFHQLKDTWQKETKYLSFSQQIAIHPAYQRIIGMGREALPLILRELESAPHHWFWALKSISGENPAPDEIQGNMKAMSECWLDWGRKAGVI